MNESNQYKWKVCIRCFTFNQAPYILDTMNGFCIQETNFPFVCTIVDDASTDGEQDVIKKYLEDNFYLDDINVVRKEVTDDYFLTFAQHKTNTNCFFAVYCLKYNHYNKKDKRQYLKEFLDNSNYEALCEGDDYWVDPLKICKQVNYLDNHPEYGLIYTNHYNRKGDKIVNFKEKGYTKFEQLVISSGIGTLTACYRLKLYNQYLEEIKPSTRHWLMGDAPLWKYLSYHSKICFLPDYTAVYRIVENSASHQNSIEKQIAFVNSGFEIQSFYIDRYIDNPNKRDKLISIATKKKISATLYILLDSGNRGEFFLYFKKNIRYFSLIEKIKVCIKLFVHSIFRS